MGGTDAEAWGMPGVLDFFNTARGTSAQVYESEWVFLTQLIRPGLRVLDVGCAQGGFASVLAEHLQDFSYTGVDVNAAMIERARARHPAHRFEVVPEGDLAVLGERRFDVVLVLGILHLHERWRATLAAAWARTAGALLFDLREIAGPTVEDRERSWFQMDFGGGDDRHRQTRLPYNLINSAEALSFVRATCPEARRVSQYGYLHPVSGSARVPVTEVMANVWCVQR